MQKVLVAYKDVTFFEYRSSLIPVANACFGFVLSQTVACFWRRSCLVEGSWVLLRAAQLVLIPRVGSLQQF